MQLVVRYAPPNDREKLKVRINEADKPEDINWYDYVRIGVKTSGSSVICKLYGDGIKEIEVGKRQPGLIRINEPLRNKLKVKIDDKVDFKIEKKTRLLAWCYFIRYHPDDIVSVAYLLAIIAIILGFISIVIAVCN
ncbi:MAG: hypothetical protein GH158_03045 [Dehalococcoidia bacterium]|nr:hypothetical protein [Dehalococcoidia bacterium]